MKPQIVSPAGSGPAKRAGEGSRPDWDSMKFRATAAAAATVPEKMKPGALIDYLPQIRELAGKPFTDVFTEEELAEMRKDKGKVGRMLEKKIGLLNTSSLKDFSDGELKTFKATGEGKPLQTVAVTMLPKTMNELLDNPLPFRESKIFDKIRHTVYVPVNKTGEVGDWRFGEPFVVDLADLEYGELLAELEEEYDTLMANMGAQMRRKAKLSTRQDSVTVHGGKVRRNRFLQERTKDSRPYTPMEYADVQTGEIRTASDKRRAFYLKKEFLVEASAAAKRSQQ